MNLLSLQWFTPLVQLILYSIVFSGANLTLLHEDDLLKKCLTGKDDPTVMSKNQEKCKEVNKGETSHKKTKNRIKQEKNNYIRREISVVSIILV